MSPIFISWLPLHPLILPLLFIPLIFVLWRRNDERKYPPGPRPLPIIGNIHQLFGGLPHRTLRQLSQQYGPIMYLKLGSKPAIVVSSSKLADDVLRKQDLDFCNRPPYPSYRKLSYNGLDVAFTTFGEHYRERRKVFNNEFLSLKRVQSIGFIREEEVAGMIASISRCALSSTPANITELMFTLTSTITSRAAFGKSYVEGTEQNVYIRSFQGLQAAFGAFFFEYYMPWLGWMDVLTGARAKLEKTFREADAFYEQVIEDHLDPTRVKQGKEDFVDSLLRMVNDQDLTRDHIKALLLNVMAGGTDTAAATVVWAMTWLIKRPRAMKKVQDEIRRIVGDKGRVEENELDQLEYLKLVVKETLRLHPVSPLLVPRETTRHCRLDGYDIAPKTLVIVNALATGREAESWENPEEFWPERFLDVTVDYKGQDFQLIPFGAGRRICPGLNFGVAVVELALANLLYCFHWKLPPGMNADDIDMSELSGLTAHKKCPLLLVPISYINPTKGKSNE